MPTSRADWQARISAWLRRWRPLLPVFAVQMIVTVGFGALLPVLPLYIQEYGIDPSGLGFIVASWAVAKLIFEPIFGWWADRHSRKPQMVAGLLVLAVVSVLPLVFPGFWALFVLRFLAGAATAAYDPAARGMVTDATHEGERGEAFGIYAAFQIGGFAIGPAIGGIGAAVFAGYAFPFVITAILSVVGAIVLALRLEPNPRIAAPATEAARVRVRSPRQRARGPPPPPRRSRRCEPPGCPWPCGPGAGPGYR